MNPAIGEGGLPLVNETGLPAICTPNGCCGEGGEVIGNCVEFQEYMENYVATGGEVAVHLAMGNFDPASACTNNSGGSGDCSLLDNTYILPYSYRAGPLSWWWDLDIRSEGYLCTPGDFGAEDYGRVSFEIECRGGGIYSYVQVPFTLGIARSYNLSVFPATVANFTSGELAVVEPASTKACYIEVAPNGTAYEFL